MSKVPQCSQGADLRADSSEEFKVEIMSIGTRASDEGSRRFHNYEEGEPSFEALVCSHFESFTVDISLP